MAWPIELRRRRHRPPISYTNTNTGGSTMRMLDVRDAVRPNAGPDTTADADAAAGPGCLVWSVFWVFSGREGWSGVVDRSRRMAMDVVGEEVRMAWHTTRSLPFSRHSLVFLTHNFTTLHLRRSPRFLLPRLLCSPHNHSPLSVLRPRPHQPDLLPRSLLRKTIHQQPFSPAYFLIGGTFHSQTSRQQVTGRHSTQSVLIRQAA